MTFRFTKEQGQMVMGNVVSGDLYDNMLLVSGNRNAEQVDKPGKGV